MAAALDEFQPGEMMAGSPYQIVARLGGAAGRMAQLYRVSWETSAGRQEGVIKIANVRNPAGAYYTEALQNEVSYLQRFRHPHLVQLLPLAEQGKQRLRFLAQHQPPQGPYYMMLEHLAHGSVADWVAANQKGLPIEAALAIVYNLATTLDYLHGYNLVHMDIKPSNVMLRQPVTGTMVGEAVLIDLGSARPTGERELAMNQTFRPSPYLAPEWIEAAHRHHILARPAIDVYALGVLLYHLLTGEAPFAAGAPHALEAAIRAGKWRPLEQLWASKAVGNRQGIWRMLDELLRTALAIDPVQRCTMASFAERLTAVRFHWHQMGATGENLRTPVSDRSASSRSVVTRLRAMALPALVFMGGVGIGATGTTLTSRGLMTPAMPVVTPATVVPVLPQTTNGATATATSPFTATSTVTATSEPTAIPTPSATATETATEIPTIAPTETPTVAPISTLAPLVATATRSSAP